MDLENHELVNNQRGGCVMTNRIWPVWQTVRIGMAGLRTAEDLQKEFVLKNPSHDKNMGAFIGAMPRRIVNEGMKIKLALVGLKNFGLPSGTRRDKFVEAMLASGLVRVPEVTGFCLRKKHRNQPEGERFHMLMEPVFVPGFGKSVLFLSGTWISCASADDSTTLTDDCKFACGIASHLVMKDIDKADALLNAAAARGFTGRVFVKQTPVGEAPLSIRRCWECLVLPCFPVMGFPEGGKREKGVISGEETTFKDDGQPVSDGRVGLYNRRMASVPQEEALQILGLKDALAEQYWRHQGFPKPAPDDCFAFGEDEIAVVSGVKQQRVVCIPDDYL